MTLRVFPFPAVILQPGFGGENLCFHPPGPGPIQLGPSPPSPLLAHLLAPLLSHFSPAMTHAPDLPAPSSSKFTCPVFHYLALLSANVKTDEGLVLVD